MTTDPLVLPPDEPAQGFTPPHDGTCDPWPVAWPCDITAYPDELVQLAYDAGWQLLWALSGRHLGTCHYTEGYWPKCQCTDCCTIPDPLGQNLLRPSGWAGSCCELPIANQPVTEVHQVLVNGAVVEPTSYFMRGTNLVYRDGCWPCAPNCDYPEVIVQYHAGHPLSSATAAAVGEVACEFLRASVGEPCKLPSRATSITRQGVTVALADPGYFLALGRIGLPIADAWLGALNPKALLGDPIIWSPDLPKHTSVNLVTP